MKKGNLFLLTFNISNIVFPVDECLQNLLAISLPAKVLIVHSEYEVSNRQALVSSVQLQLGIGTFGGLGKFDCYVIAVENVSQVAVVLERLYKNEFWNPHAKTIFFSRGNIDLLLRLSWRYFLVDAFVVTDLLVFSYKFSPEISGRFIGNCRELTALPLQPLEEIYRNRTLATMVYVMKPFTIDPHSVDNPGYDIKIVKEIMQQLGIRVEFLKHSYFYWGEKTPNGSYTHVMNHLIRDEVNFIISFQPNESYFHDFEFTTYYSNMRLPFWTPPPRNVEEWKKVLLVFPTQVWLIAFVVIFFVPLLTPLFSKLEKGKYGSFGYTVLNLWKSTFSQDFEQPATKQLKLLFFVWSLYNFVLTTSFQNCLVSILFRRLYYQKINTLQDLVGSGLSYGGIPVLKYRIRVQNTTLSEQVYKNYKNCDYSNDCLFRVAENSDFAMLKSSGSVYYAINEFPERLLDEYGIPKVVKTDYSLNIDHSICVRKGFPLVRKFTRIILLFKQAGLTIKWDTYGSYRSFERSNHRFKKIMVSHLLLPLLILITGLVASIVAFVIELNISITRMRKLRNV